MRRRGIERRRIPLQQPQRLQSDGDFELAFEDIEVFAAVVADCPSAFGGLAAGFVHNLDEVDPAVMRRGQPLPARPLCFLIVGGRGGSHASTSPSPNKKSREMPSSLASEYSTPADGVVTPRSTWDTRLAEQPARRASSRTDMPRAVRICRSRPPSPPGASVVARNSESSVKTAPGVQ